MIELLIFLSIVLISYGLGKTLLSLFKKDHKGLLEEFVFSEVLGLGILAYSIYIIGSAGFLYKEAVLSLIFLFGLFAVRPVYDLVCRIRLPDMAASIKTLNGFEKFLLITVIFIPSVSLFGAFAPEIGNDTLAYHLYHPKIFIENNRIGYIPFTRESLWPYLTEMLFTIGLILKSVTIAKLFHYFFGVLSVMALYSFARRFFGRKEALLASALFYSAPGIFMQSVYSYVDLSLCLYSFLALYIFIVWSEKAEDIKLIALSGVFTGLALSVKVLGGITLISLSCMMIIILFRKRKGPASFTKNISIFILSALLVSCVWYIRSYIVTGNPVYPFFYNVFNSGWPSDLGKHMGYMKGIIGFFRLPWDLVIHLDSFGAEQIGVISLAFLPAIFFAPFKKRVVQLLAVFIILYAAIWFYIDPNIRFAFAGLAVFYLLIALGLSAFFKKYNSFVIASLLSICILFNLSLCLYYNLDAIKLAGRAIDEKSYFYKTERTHPVAEFVNETLPENSLLIVVFEPRLFYFGRKILIYDIWRRVSQGSLESYIKDNFDISKTPVYILYDQSARRDEIEKLIKGKKAVYRMAREGDNGAIASYAIYRIY